MKKLAIVVVSLLAVLAIAGALYYLYVRSAGEPVIAQTEAPTIADIAKKTMSTGAIVPRREVEIKPKVSGVLAELYVEPGQTVKAGDPLGKIAIIPDAQQIDRAEAQVRLAQIAFDDAQRELGRYEALFARGIVAEAEVQQFRTQFALRRQDLTNARSNLTLVTEGAKSRGKDSTLVVTATVDGMVIDVPVKKGFSVIQANNFNAGTTIATIADMEDLIFLGTVDESEIAKLKKGMRLTITMGALDKTPVEGTLQYIAPKGMVVDGVVKFEIKVDIAKTPGVEIRANYSANGAIVIEERRQVLAIREALVQYDKGKPFVEVEIQPQRFEKRYIKLGLSDGINVEVLEGVAKTDKIKRPVNTGA